MGNRRIHRFHRRRLLLTMAALGAALPDGPPSIAMAQEETSAPYAVDPAYLRNLLDAGETDVQIIDVSPLRAYRAEHIPGAIHEFWEDTVDREYPHFGAVVTQGEDQRQRIDFVRKLAVHPDTYVVAYDDAAGYRAARIVWYLRFLGFDRVSLLEGGLQSWRDAGLPTQPGVNTVDAAASAVVAPREGFYVVTRQLLGRIASEQPPLIVDSRTDEERKDDLDRTIPKGAIPGSIHYPWTSMVETGAGGLRDPDALGAAFRDAGLTPDRQVIVYGLFGVDAALPWLTLKHLAYPNVAIYDRGWVEWASWDDLAREAI